MEAVVFDGKALTVKFEKKYPLPKIVNDDDVIVKVEYSGVCGTDLHIIQGEFPATKERPIPLGHEFSGVVYDVGKASIFKKGQKVVVDPNRACNLCDFCRKGKYQYCLSAGINSTVGIWKEGGWAQYVRIPQDQVYILPDGITTEQAGLCEPYSCVSHGFDRASPLLVGEKILVVGAGIIDDGTKKWPDSCKAVTIAYNNALPRRARLLRTGTTHCVRHLEALGDKPHVPVISPAPIPFEPNTACYLAAEIGNLWVTTLHHHGHRDVTVSEMNKIRLNIVKGLDTGFRLVTPDVLDKENQLYDVIIDCTGVGKVMEISFNYLKPGGKYVLFGCCPPTHQASVNPFQIYNKELTVIGVKINPFSFPNAIGLLSAMGSRYLDYKKLGVKTYALSEYQEALEDLKTGSVAKAVFKIV